MSERYEQHLLIPGLLDNLEVWHRDFGFNASAPQLVKKLSSLNLVRLPQKYGLLASVYGLLESHANRDTKSSNTQSHAHACYQYDFQHDSKALELALKTGQEKNQQAILCAEPIELEAGMSDIAIGQHLIDDLTREENLQLADELNHHFSQDGWQFVVSASGNWYLLLPEDQKPDVTIPVEQALGQSLRDLIEGMESVQWSSQINELQMLLYGSGVNQSRESQKLRQVNSFWMWDVDVVPNKTNSDVTFIKGGDYQGKVIANRYGLDYSSFDEGVKQQMSGVYLYTELMEPVRFNNVELWQQKLTELEGFIADLLESASTDIVIHSCNGYLWRTGKKSIWNVLRKRKKSLLDFL